LDHVFGFCCLRYLDKSDTAGGAPVSLSKTINHGFDGALGCKNFPELLLGYRDVQLPARMLVTTEVMPPFSNSVETGDETQKAILKDRLSVSRLR
jgi:hypothetical protein